MLFTFCYLFFLQGELLAQAQYIYSEGVTEYSVLYGALIITAILQLVQWLVSLAVRLPGRFHALSYVPSFLALAMLTDINQATMEHFSFGLWTWLAPTVFFLFVLLVFAAHRIEALLQESTSMSWPNILWPNYLALFVLMLLCGGTQIASDAYMYELKTERLILLGRYADAAAVGRKSLANSRRLSNLRMYALSMQDSLPYYLFSYPQEHGMQGLLCLSDTDARHRRLTATDIAASMGFSFSRQSMPIDRCFQLAVALNDSLIDSLVQVDSLRLASSDSLRRDRDLRLRSRRMKRHRAADYFLCALLLKRDLKTFAAQLPLYYPYNDTVQASFNALPTAYQQAMVLVTPELGDSALLADYFGYEEMKDTLRSPVVRRNLTRRRFGKTYWWYYDNPRPAALIP